MPRLVDAAAAAYYAGCSVGSIWRWASEGRIASHHGQYDLDQLDPAERDEYTREITYRPPPPPLPDGAHAA